MSSWTGAEWVAFSALIATAIGVILTAATLIIVLFGEIRYRRQYHGVDWEIDHVGTLQGANGVTVEKFRLINIGAVSATRVSMLLTEALQASSEQHRPISYMRPGESREFVATVTDIEKAWALLSWTPVDDKRIVEYAWSPLKPDGALMDRWIEQLGIAKREKRALVKALGGKPVPVGPNGALYGRMDAKKPEKRRLQDNRISEHGIEWLKQRQTQQTENREVGTTAS